jgi:DNA-binding response OmpR family regulator
MASGMGHRIPIVDDEPSIVASLEFLMRRSGHETVAVRDGEQAPGAAKSFRPDLVLLDVMLPHRDGFQVCQQLRAEGWTDLKIVMLTAKLRAARLRSQGPRSRRQHVCDQAILNPRAG